jgi:hypothetical protein
MHVVRKEEKEARLNAFLTEQLAVAAGRQSPAQGLNVLARSFESPILKALAVHAATIASAGLAVRVVVVQAEGGSPEVTAFLDGATVCIGCDARLLDAHEQLAIGDKIAWIGDCMRREPMKRDAYEIYSSDCAETAALAHRSFERVWSFARAGKPELAVAAPAVAPAGATVEMPMAVIAEGEPAPLVSTRH